MAKKIIPKTRVKRGIEPPPPRKFQPVVKHFNPNELIPYAANAKVHTPDQISRIARQISQFGFTQPILVDKNMVIIAGHCRRAAALDLELKTVPVIIHETISEEDAKAIRIADNKLAEAPWNKDMLVAELASLKEDDYDLLLTGFNVEEVDCFLRITDEMDDDEDEEKPKKKGEPEAPKGKKEHECPRCGYEF